MHEKCQLGWGVYDYLCWWYGHATSEQWGFRVHVQDCKIKENIKRAMTLLGNEVRDEFVCRMRWTAQMTLWKATGLSPELRRKIMRSLRPWWENADVQHPHDLKTFTRAVDRECASATCPDSVA